MKIFVIGNISKDRIGGGWSFLSSFLQGDWDITLDPEECDIYFITSVSMLDKVSQIPFGKRKVVLRVDNALLDSRNGRIYGLEGDEKITRMEAMKQIAQRANAIVYQSKWSKNYIKPFLENYIGIERIILNGIDQIIFTPDGSKIPSSIKTYLYVRSSNHDNKQWHVAKYWFEMQSRHEDCQLLIAGRFSSENLEHNFDFWNDENWKYLGFIQDKETMALYMRSVDTLLMPFWMDTCSNTVLEAISSGLKVKYLTGGLTGGNWEIVKAFKKYGREYFSLERMNTQYKELFEQL